VERLAHRAIGIHTTQATNVPHDAHRDVLRMTRIDLGAALVRRTCACAFRRATELLADRSRHAAA